MASIDKATREIISAMSTTNSVKPGRAGDKLGDIYKILSLYLYKDGYLQLTDFSGEITLKSL
jgi:hypothetical protein